MRDIRADINARRVLAFPDEERNPLGSMEVGKSRLPLEDLRWRAQKAKGGARRFLLGAKTKGRRGSSGPQVLENSYVPKWPRETYDRCLLSSPLLFPLESSA